MTVPRPLLTPRLIRATRTGSIVFLALVVLHYLGLIGTPPPPLPRLAVYLVIGGAALLLHAAVEWLYARRTGARPGA